jgi:leukotriene-A4 hydrolase
LEAAVGREKFDPFLKSYFDTYAFQAITTEIFIDYLNTNLLEPNKIDFNTDEWIHGEGIPDNCVVIESDRFDIVTEKAKLITTVTTAKELNIKKEDWTTHEWIHFIRQIPAEADAAKMEMLDKEFNFSTCGNAEIMSEWYLISIQKGYDKINKPMETFLINVGRRKYLQPLYEELAKTEDGLAFAKQIYAKARPNYHSVSSGTIDEILNWEE